MMRSDCLGVVWVSDLVLGLQPIIPLDLPVKVRSWELTVYPREGHVKGMGSDPNRARLPISTNSPISQN